MKKAILFKQLPGLKVQCLVCNHFCLISSNGIGRCGVRKNIKGILYSLNYGKIVAQHIDPIVKKPIFNYLPKTLTYSIALAGCNFHCWHCQNADISQISDHPDLISQSAPEATPLKVIKQAQKYNCPSLAYTYTEPTIWIEFALDCMKLAHLHNLKNIWISNAYMSDQCLDLILPYLDAINVDLKFFNNKSYQKICGTKLKPILNNLIKIKKAGVHLEVTTLIIPNINDSKSELKDIADFMVQKLGKNTPWHVNAFYPAYKMIDILPTPVATIKQARRIGQAAGLKYVYPGNI